MEKHWLNNYPKEIPHEVEIDNKPLQFYLADAARRNPTKPALYFLGKRMTYGEVYDSALKLANQLKSLGLNKGERVAIMLPNSPQSVISYYAVLIAGGIVVQTNPLYKERELEHQLVDSGAKIIIGLDLLFPKVEAVRKRTSLKHVIVTGVKDYLPFPKNLLYPFVQKRQTNIVVRMEYTDTVHSLKQLIEDGLANEIELDLDPKEDLALLQYTGGTTGPAKGVMLTHYNLVANTMQCRYWMYKAKYGEEKILGALPFFHVYGMTCVMNFSIMYLAEMIILPKFDPKQVLKSIEKQKPTMFPGAPTMYIGLLNHPNIENFDLSSIRNCISGSAPLPVEVQANFEAVTGGNLVEGYGLTEASPVTHANFLYGSRVKGSIGLPWPNTDAAILSAENGRIADLNEVGELMVKGPQVMKGYWNQPEESAATFHDGWLLTGDMGYMDENGYFYIVDRKKDMIIAGGFNIYPREVEEILFEHPDVLEATVIGVPDPYRGETVKAFIVLKDGVTCSEEELNVHCRKHLASFKAPRLYEFREELPKTMVGKVLRRVLVEEEKRKLKEQEQQAK
ncbi:AMP-binding protein [Pseudalkalibacillus decolorationis]|uniref:AMP-binding protein n=1 Tax=Pseudalkalibacillus decolorationis TaxID=163879 RepID=UPI0027E2ACA3|nr:AMP-binding protein [Pseudalkalibacillus decolorationis]